MANINKYIEVLLHPAGGHQGSHKAHRAGNQRINLSYISHNTTLERKCVLISAPKRCIVDCGTGHNERNGVSNHRRLDCLFNHFFRRRSNKTSMFRVTGLCAGNSPATGEFPAQRPVTRKMLPFDDVIMCIVTQVTNDA